MMMDQRQQKAVDITTVFGGMATRTVGILNGGGAIALLTFIGNLTKQDNPASTLGGELVPALICFFIGAACSAFVAAAGYFNGLAAQSQNKSAMKFWIIMGALLFFLGMALFLAGGYFAAFAFKTFWAVG